VGSQFDPLQLKNLDGSTAATVTKTIYGIYRLLMSRDGSRVFAIAPKVRVYKIDGIHASESVLAGVDGGSNYYEALSTDGSRILLAKPAWGEQARVLSTDGSSDPLVLRGQSEDVMGLSLSPDGKSAVTIGQSGSAWLWNLEQLRRLAPDALRQALWEAYPACASSAAVGDFMNRTGQAAMWDADNCSRMNSCLEAAAGSDPLRGGDPRYERCLTAFRSDQHSWWRDNAIRRFVSGLLP
jgi:WD40 repeat protein